MNKMEITVAWNQEWNYLNTSYMSLLLTMYCSFLFINDKSVSWIVYTLYKLSMSVYVLYESVYIYE